MFYTRCITTSIKKIRILSCQNKHRFCGTISNLKNVTLIQTCFSKFINRFILDRTIVYISSSVYTSGVQFPLSSLPSTPTMQVLRLRRPPPSFFSSSPFKPTLISSRQSNVPACDLTICTCTILYSMPVLAACSIYV